MTGATTWTEPEELLLRAAVGSGDAADRAYDAWRGMQDLRDLDGAAHRVLPLLAQRLSDADDDAVAQQVRRVVRFTWLRTQFLIDRCLPGIRALRDAGLPVMLAKGTAVLAHTGWEIQLRPMDDLDVVVHREHAAQAVDILRATGRRQPSLPSDPASTSIYDEIHALPFGDEAGAELDLHWHVLHGSLHRGADAEFWERSRPARIRDVPLAVLAAEDTFVQVAGHGMQVSAEHPLRWAADAVLLLRGTPAFDWDLVAETASRHRMAREIGGAVDALARVAPDLVPARLPPCLRRGRRRLRPTTPEAAAAREFVRRTVAPGEPVRAGHALAYVKEVWALDRARRIPAHAAWIVSGRRPRLAPRDELPPGGPPQAPAEPSFQAGTDGVPFLGPGWWSSDLHGTWSRGREAVVVLPLPADGPSPLLLDIWLVPYLSTAQPVLDLDVFVDGTRAARGSFRGSLLREERCTVRLPGGERSSLAVRFVQRTPRISPTRASDLADPRPLGFALRRMRLVTEA